HRLTEHRAVATMKVIRRHAREIGQQLQIRVGVGVACQPAQDGIHAPGVLGQGSGFQWRAPGGAM
ncbi:hypothetical protein NO135_25300, partial [Clostridioides difficile]|nr:hypothetical protein [Clostridioides difficile]